MISIDTWIITRNCVIKDIHYSSYDKIIWNVNKLCSETVYFVTENVTKINIEDSIEEICYG